MAAAAVRPAAPLDSKRTQGVWVRSSELRKASMIFDLSPGDRADRRRQ